MNPSINESSAGAVIFNVGKERRYLLLHYPEGHWDFPKGNIEKHESQKQAALREIKEETSLADVTFIRGFKEKLHYCYTRNKNSILKEVAFFLAAAYKSKVKLSFEHTGFEWLPYKKALDKLTYRNIKVVLKKAEEFLIANHFNNQSFVPYQK